MDLVGSIHPDWIGSIQLDLVDQIGSVQLDLVDRIGSIELDLVERTALDSKGSFV